MAQPDTSGASGTPPFVYLPLSSAKTLPPAHAPRHGQRREDVRGPADPSLNVTNLKGDRRLLSINTRSGAITSTAIETFYLNNPSYPYEAAESGQKDVQP